MLKKRLKKIILFLAMSPEHNFFFLDLKAACDPLRVINPLALPPLGGVDLVRL